MLWMALVAAIAAVFFLLIPGIGAFIARARWRAFRGSLLAISRWPSVGSSREEAGQPGAGATGHPRDGFVGYRRYFGVLEALQGDDRVWLAGEGGSVAAELRGVRVFILPTADSGKAADEQISSVSWDRVFSLPAGTPVLVGGALFQEAGRPVFKTSGDRRPMVLIYDCPREEILRRAIHGGRHANEYWNELTVPSLVTGSFILLALAWLLLGNVATRIPALAALTVGLGPVAPFLPPAFPLYFAYRWSWRKARRLRAQRDLVRLPMRWFPPPDSGDRRVTLLPDLEPYVMLRGARDGAGGTIAWKGTVIRVEGRGKAGPIEVPRGCARRLAAADAGWAFGTIREGPEGLTLARPADPLAELLVLPGDPREIARSSVRAANLYVLASALLIGIGLAVNLAIILYAAGRLLD